MPKKIGVIEFEDSNRPVKLEQVLDLAEKLFESMASRLNQKIKEKSIQTKN